MAKKKKPQRARAGSPKLFVAEYLIDHNATQAAIRCGYSKGSAPVTGARLSTKYKATIEAKIAQSNARLEVTADRIRQELAELAYLPIEGIEPHMLRAKCKALELLAKHSGMLVERHEVNTGEGISIYIPENDRSTTGVDRADEEGLDG